jgi:nucleotidyltransferase substrate binding protein (TIGR01987 family)
MTNEKLQNKFKNFKRAIQTFEEVCQEEITGKLALAGLIKHFEFTLEVSWKMLKFFLEYKDIGTTMIGSKDTIRAAFANKVLENPEIWLIMLRERNNTAHMYDEEFVSDLTIRIKDEYLPEFIKLLAEIEPLVLAEEGN